MATAENIAGTESGNQVIGKVSILYGNVKAISSDGTERALSPNSLIFAHDRVITESDGMVSITIDDGAQTQIDIGRMSDVVIDEDIFAGVSAEDAADAAAEVEQIQEALLAETFDPTVELEAAAAGESPATGGGHPVPDFARVTHEGDVTSGAETTGIGFDTVGTIPGVAEPPNPVVTVAINAEGGLVPEGDDAVFTVTVNDASENAQLTLGLSDGTALTASDYNLSTFQYNDGSGWQDITGPITLSAGTNTLLIRTDTVADNIDEPDENFSLSAEIVNENGASASASAEAIIVDGDVPTVTVSDDIKTEGDTEIFTVTVAKAADGAELTLNLTDGSAEAPADYNATTFEYSTDNGDSWQDVSSSITLTEGNHEILVRTDTAVDDLLEGDENFFLNAELTNAGGDPVPDTGEGIIIEGTPEPEPEPEPEPVTLSISDDFIPEGDDGVFTVTIGDAPAGAQLNLGLSEGSADDPADYHAVMFEYNTGSGWLPITGPIDIPAGDSSLQVRTDTVDDSVDESNESFFVNGSISDTEGTIIADSGTGVILDNDIPPPPPQNILTDGNESVSTPGNTPVSGNVLDNTTNPDGPDPASVVDFTINGTTYTAGDTASITGVGTLTIGSDGAFTFTPADNYDGPVPDATYTVTDGADTDTSTLSIAINAANDLADGDESVSTAEDTPVSGNVLDNTTNPDGPDPASVVDFTINGTTYTAGDTASITGVGTLTIGSDGAFTFTPADNYDGPVPDATYTVTDGADTDTSTLSIAINAANDLADGDESVSTAEDTPVSGNVLDNTTNPDGPDPASVVDFTINGTTYTAGDTASITGVGTLTIGSDGAFTFTPADNYDGPVPDATYTVTDGADTDTSTLSIAINAANDLADGDESVSTAEDTPVSGNVLDNTTNPDGPDPASVVDFTINGTTYTAGDTASITGVGTLTIGSDGAFTFTPADNYDGPVPDATYTVTDGADTDTSTLSIAINAANDLADGDESVSTAEDTPVSGNVLDNTTNPDGPDPASVVDFTINGTTYTAGDTASITGVGTLTIGSDGAFTFTPADNYDGPVPDATYTVTDGADTDTSTLSIAINAANDLADGDESVSTAEDTPVSGNVLDNTTNPDGPDPASVVDFTINGTTYTAGDTASITGVGTLTIGSDGAFTFTPADNYDGPVPDATYTVTDGADTDTSTLSIAINAANDLADGDESVSTAEDTPVSGNVLDNTTNPDGPDPASVVDFTINGTTYTAGDTASITGVGTLTIGSDGAFTFTPADNYDGPVPDATYTVTDGADTDTSTLSIAINAANDLADGDESVSTAEDTPVSGNVLDNTTNPDGPDPASVVDFTINGTTYTAGDTASITGVGTLTIGSDGAFTFTPADNYDGPVPDATYTVTDGADTDTSTLSIAINAANDLADGDESVSTAEDTPVSGNVLDNTTNPDGPDPASVVDFTINGTTYTAGDTASITGVGTLTIGSDGAFTFTPADNYDGPVPDATYTVTDGADTDTSTLSIAINAANDLADGDESVSTAEDTPVSGNVLDNTTNPDGPDPASVVDFTINGTTYTAGDTASITGVGTLTIGSDGAFTFTPADNYDGPVPDATYTVTDGADTDTSTLSIAINAANDLADGDESVSTAEDTPVSGNVLDNTTNPDGPDPASVVDFTINGTTYTADDTASITGVGTLTIGSDGAFTFTPADNYDGPVPDATYTVTDGADTDISTLSIAINAGNDLADGDESVSTAEDTPVSGNVLDNTTNPDGPDPASVVDFTINGTTYTAGDTASITGVGTLTIGSDGAFTFTPADNYDGPVPDATYTVTDGADTDTSTLSIAINAANDLADGDESVSTAEDTPVSGNVLDNTTNPDGPDPASVVDFTINGTTYTAGDTASITGVGTLTIGSDGAFTFTPADNYDGPVPDATYTVTDGADTDTSTLSIAINAANDLADGDESVSTAEDTPVSGNVLDNTTNPDGPDPASVVDFTINGTTYTAGDTASITGVGTLTIGSDGAFTFTPADNYDGPVPDATYTVTDGADTDTSTLSIAINAANDLADGDESVSTAEDTPVSGNVLDNTTNPDGPDPASVVDFTINGTTYTAGDTASITGVGTLTIGSDGAFTFTPADNYDGPVPDATYTVTDGADTDTSTLSIAINAANDLADGDESVSTAEDTPVSGNVLDNTTNPDGPDPASVVDFTINGTTYTAGDTASITGVGTLTIGSDGAFTFTPADNYDGPVPDATYTVTDGADTDTSTLSIAINSENDAPTMTVDSGTVYESGLPEGTGTSPNNVTDSGQITYDDVDGDTLNLIINGVDIGVLDGNYSTILNSGNPISGTNGELTVHGDGSWDYVLTSNVDNDSDLDPRDDWGNDSFEVKINDGTTDNTPQNLVIDISDDIPDIGDPQNSLLANVTGNALTADLDIIFGADGVSTDGSNPPIVITGEENGSGNVIGYLSDSTVVELTSNGSKLHYEEQANGDLIAEDSSNKAVFTVSSNSLTGEYTVTINGTLDAPILGDETSFSDFDIINPGGGADKYAEGLLDNGVDYIRASSTNGSINISGQGMGIASNHINTGQVMDIQILNGTTDQPIPQTEVSILVDHLSGDGVSGGTEADEILTWSVSRGGIEIADGEFRGNLQGASDEADQLFSIDEDLISSNLINSSETDYTFDLIKFGFDSDEAFTGNEGYRVLAITAGDSEPQDITIKLNGEVTDDDLDSDSTAEPFEVTFNNDAVLDGTIGDISVIQGSAAGGETILADDNFIDYINSGGGIDTVDLDTGPDIDSLIDPGGDDILS